MDQNKARRVLFNRLLILFLRPYYHREIPKMLERKPEKNDFSVKVRPIRLKGEPSIKLDRTR
jgi:hypothetical protein